jgi:hypothetical protein
MTRDDVTKAQAKQVREALYRPTNYLVRLRRRMELRGFPPNDPLYVLVSKAFDALQHLGMHVHHFRLPVTPAQPQRAGLDDHLDNARIGT